MVLRVHAPAMFTSWVQQQDNLKLIENAPSTSWEVLLRVKFGINFQDEHAWCGVNCDQGPQATLCDYPFFPRGLKEIIDTSRHYGYSECSYLDCKGDFELASNTTQALIKPFRR